MSERERACTGRCRRAKGAPAACGCVCRGANHGTDHMIPELIAQGEPALPASPPLDPVEILDHSATVPGTLMLNADGYYIANKGAGRNIPIDSWLDEMLYKPVTLIFTDSEDGTYQVTIQWKREKGSE